MTRVEAAAAVLDQAIREKERAFSAASSARENCRRAEAALRAEVEAKRKRRRK